MYIVVSNYDMCKGGVVWDLIKACKAKKQYNGDNVRLFKNHTCKEADGLIKYNNKQ